MSKYTTKQYRRMFWHKIEMTRTQLQDIADRKRIDALAKDTDR
jgi:hypothetical protein